MPPKSKPTKKKTYDVRSVQTGALVVIGVDNQAARAEAKRLSEEAAAINPETGKPNGLERGEVTRYEVTTNAGSE